MHRTPPKPQTTECQAILHPLGLIVISQPAIELRQRIDAVVRGDVPEDILEMHLADLNSIQLRDDTNRRVNSTGVVMARRKLASEESHHPRCNPFPH